MTCLPETLNCGDATLRPMCVSDLAALRLQLSDFGTSEWLAAINYPFGEDDANELLRSSLEPERNVRVIEKNGKTVGCISVGPSMWYWLAPESCGQGLMHRVLQKAISVRFANGAPPVSAVCRQDNVASIALLTKLGFSRAPDPKRMFFRAAKRSALCFEYLMTPEQWFCLNPPDHEGSNFRLRAATIKDTPRITQLPTADWGAHTEDLSAFIESHRYRGPGAGLFVLDDDYGAVMGLALLNDGEVSLLSSTDADLEAKAQEIGEILQKY